MKEIELELSKAVEAANYLPAEKAESEIRPIHALIDLPLRQHNHRLKLLRPGIAVLVEMNAVLPDLPNIDERLFSAKIALPLPSFKIEGLVFAEAFRNLGSDSFQPGFFHFYSAVVPPGRIDDLSSLLVDPKYVDECARPVDFEWILTEVLGLLRDDFSWEELRESVFSDAEASKIFDAWSATDTMDPFEQRLRRLSRTNLIGVMLEIGERALLPSCPTENGELASRDFERAVTDLKMVPLESRIGILMKIDQAIERYTVAQNKGRQEDVDEGLPVDPQGEGGSANHPAVDTSTPKLTLRWDEVLERCFGGLEEKAPGQDGSRDA